MAIYADYGVTGTDLRQRPELNRLLTDCRAGRVNCIVAVSYTHLKTPQLRNQSVLDTQAKRMKEFIKASW